jgi:hypothetical protein
MHACSLILKAEIILPVISQYISTKTHIISSQKIVLFHVSYLHNICMNFVALIVLCAINIMYNFVLYLRTLLEIRWVINSNLLNISSASCIYICMQLYSSLISRLIL